VNYQYVAATSVIAFWQFYPKSLYSYYKTGIVAMVKHARLKLIGRRESRCYRKPCSRTLGRHGQRTERLGVACRWLAV